MSFHLQADLVTSDLHAPVFAASPPGEPELLFVLEKNTGLVRILDVATGELSTQPFFRLPRAQFEPEGERGLLGMAFHPDYASNGKLYLDFNNEQGDTEIWEITRSAADPRRADPASARSLLTIDRTAINHNGGWLGFGPDGYLYIASGDGGGGGDPRNAAQSIDELRGKILRIDVDSDAFPLDLARNYGIPPDNPFVGVAGADEVFAYGLRNPWRPSFDAATGDLYIADVGQNAREEIDYLPAGTGAGTNFGWRVLEGTLPTGYPQLANPDPDDPGLRAPIYEYEHGLGDFQGFSLTGGYVYHGAGPADGLYFFADFVSDHLWTLRVVNGQAVDLAQQDDRLVVNGGTVDRITSFALDGNGELYVLGYDGDIHHLTAVPDPAAPDPVVVAPASQPDTDETFFGLGDAGGAAALLAFAFGWLI